MALLQVKKITRYFKGLAALHEVDLEVLPGEILGIIGPNGAGKTTLFNVVTGFLNPSSGQILFKGEDITGLKPEEIAAKGLLRTFQITSLYGNFSAVENVMVAHHLQEKIGFWSALLNTASYRKKEKYFWEKSREMLRTFAPQIKMEAPAESLPHGHQQNLGLLMPLAAKPELLMLDEPVTGMNMDETTAMMDRIQKVRDSGVTIVLVEHNMRTVMGICDRIAVLNYGGKIAEGSPAEIIGNKQVIEAYLGSGE
jgi:branched-chain amino acid transport system ATP-binding protein